MHSELDNANVREVLTAEKAQETDTISLEHKSMVTSPVSPQMPPQNNANTGRVQTKKEQRSGNTLYQELSFQVGIIKVMINYLLIIISKFIGWRYTWRYG